MQRPSWVTRPFVIIAAAVVVVAAVVVIVIVRRTGAPGGVAADETKSIPAGGGVELSAEVFTPKGDGPFPLVVMAGSWGSKAREYKAIGLHLARDGYQAVSYAQRGFGGSGGSVDFGAEPTQADASRVIDWALAHTHADAHRIGMLGVSYGGGVALLAAARDPRIRAVVAMSTWSDLARCFHPNDTTSVTALGSLLGQAQANGHLSAQLSSVRQTLTRNPAAGGADMAALGPVRSPMSVVDELDKNRPAIMLANGFEDSIIAPQQLVDFYGKLTVPKRLQLAPGDHGGPEYAGLLGAADVTVDTAETWLDHYLKGTANGIDKQDPIQLQDVITRAWRGYRSWPDATTELQLGRPSVASNVSIGAPQTWTAPVAAGVDSGAASGPVLYLSARAYKPPTVALAAVNPAHAFAWNAPPVSKPTLVSGTPRLSVTAASSTGAGTLIAYLYDVDPAGAAALMSVKPYTVQGATAATPAHVSFDLEPTSWTVAAGHHVTLIIDTVDSRWHSASAPGSTLTLSSSTTTPASLALPVAP